MCVDDLLRAIAVEAIWIQEPLGNRILHKRITII